jgi:hypothetical protein
MRVGQPAIRLGKVEPVSGMRSLWTTKTALSMSVGETAISSLINARTQALGISRVELVGRCGFKNIAKGLRRLDEVCAGNVDRAGLLLAKLPDALSLEPQVVTAAILATRQAQIHEQQQRYRDAFRPHGVIICERSIPEPIWLAAVIGVERILRIDFKDGSAPISYVRQAIEGLEAKLRKGGSSALPAFGLPQGVVVNYAYDKAVEFDVEGEPLRVFDEAVRTGVGTLLLAGRPITAKERRPLIGVSEPPHLK